MAVLSILLFPPFLLLLVAVVIRVLGDLVEELRPRPTPARAPHGA